MPGRMGGQQVTVQNVKVMRVDDEHGIIVLHGMSIYPSICSAPPCRGLFERWMYVCTDKKLIITVVMFAKRLHKWP